MADPEWTGERRAAKLAMVEGLRVRAAIYIQSAPRTPAGKQMQRAADTIEQLYGALKEARGQVVALMLTCGHCPDEAVENVSRLDAALSAARDTGGVE